MHHVLIGPTVPDNTPPLGRQRSFRPVGAKPSGCEVRIVGPWPRKVFEATSDMAGRAPSPELLRALWDVVDPVDRYPVQSGVREAA